MTTGRTLESVHFGLVIEARQTRRLAGGGAMTPIVTTTALLHSPSLSIQHGHSKGQQVRFRRHRLRILSPNLILTQPSRSSSFARRKAFAIKHQEAEPLTRRDLQYDFLYHIFAAPERVFTDPTLPAPPKEDGVGGGGGTVTFRDLYVHALMSSPRCSKALREKMQETPEFATDFAKMSLLANVGRVNTTMTCPSLFPFCLAIYHSFDRSLSFSPSGVVLPEMRTALRTYHPVPSLQKADANLQDAPRIKNILKACSLKDEAATNMPVTPAELRARAVST